MESVGNTKHVKISISKIGLFSVISFFFLSLFGRILYPFGDEPDFTIRAPRVINGEHSWWSPYYLFSDFFKLLDSSSACQIESSPFSLSAYIDPFYCIESLEQILFRWLFTFFLLSPFFVMIVFRNQFFMLFRLWDKKLTKIEWNLKQKALAVSLLFPGVIYYLGVFAEEQLTLMLSLLIFIVWRQRLFVLLILALIFSIDYGNSIVVAGFVFSSWFYTYLLKFFKLKIIILFLLIQISSAYLIGFAILEFTSSIAFLSDKSDAMLSSIDGGGYVKKYPVLLRPVITFMSFIYSSPAYIKVPFLYILFGVFFLHASFKLTKKYKYFCQGPISQSKNLDRDVVLALVGLGFVLSVVFMFPTYGNAKYYVFLMPFFMAVILRLYSPLNSTFVMIISNIILYLHLLVYRL